MSYRVRLILLMAAAAVAVVLLAIWPKVQERLAPVPVRAWVAIQVEGRGIAEVGRVEIRAGERFTLHAVLEARTRDGARVFYTEAQAVGIDGAEVADTELRPWSGQPVKVMWFTVEGETPVVFLKEGQTMSQFHYREFLRPEWGTGWLTSGSVSPANDQHLTRSSLLDPEPFGTQRFHVRIELFAKASDLMPVERYSSWDSQDLLERLPSFPTVVARQAGGAGHASSFFGLSEIVPAEDGNDETLQVLASLTHKSIAYSGLTLLRDLVDDGGGPEWRMLDLASGPSWGEKVREGDLLRVGPRFVVLYEDRGEPGVLDSEDLVLDFHLGSKVARLSEVFEGKGALGWAALGRKQGAS